MTMHKVAQRIPFKPSKTQAALLEQCFGARRFAYNQQVEVFNTYDKEMNPNPKYPNVTGMKNANEWLKDSPIPSISLSNAIMDFRKAQSAYFRKAQYDKNRPRFALKSNNIQSFRNTAPIRRMEGNRYPLSRKLGSVRIRRGTDRQSGIACSIWEASDIRRASQVPSKLSSQESSGFNHGSVKMNMTGR